MDIYKKYSKEDYKKYSKEKMPKSNLPLGCLKAFIVGGAICTLGECIRWVCGDVFMFSKEEVGAFTSALLIFLGAFFTGLGLYDVMGNFAGAGSIVPISGFANSIVAPAMEYRREGLVLGVGAKMFIIAGPVLVYGIGASVVLGVIYKIMGV